MRLAAAVAICALEGGCAAPPTLGDRSDAIINGTDDDGRDPSVVLLTVDLGSDRIALCSASIITRRTILTAAHCLKVETAAGPFHVRFLESWNLDTDEKTGVVDSQDRLVTASFVDPA